MRKQSQFQNLLRQIKVVKAPKYRLATFGTTKIDYVLVTDMPGLPDRSKLRFGQVTAEKPLIITPQSLKERFTGFGDEGRDLAERMAGYYGEALRGLEYQFHNEPSSTRVELSKPDQLIKEMMKDFEGEDGYRRALIRGAEKYWPLSIMKFIIEETMASFAHNVSELNDRGFFDGEKRLQDLRHREIKRLFEVASRDKGVIATLAQKLKEYELFDEYQDPFFRLIR